MKRAVVDQPGLRIIVLGLVVSIICGLFIKNQISSKKIKLKIDQSLVKLQTDVSVDFKSVEVKLSDWGWPQPYLEIHDIRLSPLKKVCDESQVFIDTLSFPLTWNLFFESKKIVKALRINQMELRISELEKCFSKTNQKSEELSKTKTIETEVTSIYQSLLQVFTANNSGELRNLKIDRIKILSKSNYELPIYLQSAIFEFLYDSQTLSKINLSAQLLSYKDNVKKIYNLRSDLNLSFEKTKENLITIVGVLNGKVVDRSYQIKFDYDFIKNGLNFNLEAEKVALRTILEYINLDKKDFFKTYKDEIYGFYLTAHGNGFFNLDNNQIEQVYLKDLIIESGVTTIFGDHLHFKNIKNIDQQALVFKVNDFNLNMILKNKSWSTSYFNEHIIESGLFSGDVSWMFGQELRAIGALKNTQLSLSNKIDGQENWLQKINSAQFEYLSTQFRSQLVLSDLVMNDKNINGFINYTALDEDGKKNHEITNVEFDGQWLAIKTLQNVFGAEKVLESSLKIKKDENQTMIEFKALDFSYYDLNIKNMYFKTQQQLSYPSATKKIKFKADEVSWDEAKILEESGNKFIQWFSGIASQINLKKVDLEGDIEETTVTLPIQLRTETKGKFKKDIFTLDFKNNIFLEVRK